MSIRTSSHRQALVNGLLILIWVAACAGTIATLAKASNATSSPTALLLFMLCVAFISVFLLNTLYFLALGAACLTDDTPILHRAELHNDSLLGLPVAILYTVKDDFDPKALQGCIDQDHAATSVFVLDDSTSREVSSEVERFLEGHGNAKTTVVRRGTPRGFKAGNLNDAISGPAKDFDYFAPVDADCVLAPHFVSSLLSNLEARSDLAFVQARCAPRVPALTSFGERTAPGVGIFWSCYESYRMKFGFPTFVGHGGLVRRAAWAAVGGFPEIVSEDLGFSIESALCGYSGLYVNDPVCYESAPGTFLSFSRRQAKYCVGALECLVKYFGIIVRGRCLRWWEKVDIVLGVMSNLVPALVIPFLGLLSAITAASIIAIGIGGTPFGIRALFLSTWAGRAGWSQLTTSFVYLLSAVALCVPGITAVLAGEGPVANRMRHLRWCTTLYLGVMVICFTQVARVIISRKPQFFVTGSRAEEIAGGRGLVAGLVLISILGLGTLNLYFLAIGVAGLIGHFHLMDDNSGLSTWSFIIPVILVTLTIVYLLTVVLGRAYFGFTL